MNTKLTDVDGYLSTVPEDARATLQAVRRTIKTLAPEAVEAISYGVPAFKYRGRPLIYLGAAKSHCALYGTAEGTIRFPPGEPPTEEHLRRLLEPRIDEIEAASAGRKRGR